jgi:hypothetical protein
MSDPIHEKARQRVDEKKKFYKNLSSFLVMSVFFFVLNVLSGGGWWFYWPILGWGIGIAMHYFKVFGFPGMGPTDEAWERREVEKEKRKLERGGDDYLEEEPLDLPDLQREKRTEWRDEDLV